MFFTVDWTLKSLRQISDSLLNHEITPTGDGERIEVDSVGRELKIEGNSLRASVTKTKSVTCLRLAEPELLVIQTHNHKSETTTEDSWLTGYLNFCPLHGWRL